MYTNGEPKGEVKNFIDFVLSPEGQDIVESVGFIRIK
jgi:phosphate transport system substrate-binding protein